MSARRGVWGDLALALSSAACFLAAAWHARAHPPPFEPGPRAEGVLRVVTWNLGAGLEHGGGGLADEWIEDVAAELAELEPDLVLLQELESSRQLARLRRFLGGEWRDALAPGLGERRVAVLARGARPEPMELDPREPRALLVRLRFPGGPELAVACVHADAFAARERNVLLGRTVDALLAAPAEHRLLGGDLNLDLDPDARGDLFTDDEYLDVETYNYVVRGLVDLARGHGSTAEPDRRLDYLFADPSVELRGAGPLAGRRLGGMDHDPVAADLVLPR